MTSHQQSVLLSLWRDTVLLRCQADPHTGAAWAEQLHQHSLTSRPVKTKLSTALSVNAQTPVAVHMWRTTNYSNFIIALITFVVTGLKIIKLHTESMWRLWLNMVSTWMLKTRETGEIMHTSKAPINELSYLFHMYISVLGYWHNCEDQMIRCMSMAAGNMGPAMRWAY